MKTREFIKRTRMTGPLCNKRVGLDSLQNFLLIATEKQFFYCDTAMETLSPVRLKCVLIRPVGVFTNIFPL